MSSALRVRDLRGGYGPVEILRGIDLDIEVGEAVAVLGRNGAGKTTLVRALMSLLPGAQGDVALFGRKTLGMSAHRVARLGVSYVPQEAGVFDELSVEENLRLALAPKRDLASAADQAFQAFPVLSDRLDQKAGTLSGGERKMLLVARMVVQEPRIVLLDEISEGVQPSNVDAIAKVLEQARSRKVSVLLVEQKVELALRLASRFVVIKQGAIVASADTRDVGVEEVRAHLTV